jgi:hypothetical protein
MKEMTINNLKDLKTYKEKAAEITQNPFGRKGLKPYFCSRFNHGLWCKGSTTDFDSVCLGSNPSNPTEEN